jgi:MFS family permease
MAYFRNAVVNLLNLHYGIFSIVTTGGGAFYCVYLLKAGVPLPGVLVAMAAILLVRFVIRPAVVPLAVRFGLRHLLIAGTALMALQFLLLARVHGVGGMLFALVIVAAIGDAVYWSCYHAYFAALGDLEHRGHQISMREAIATLVGIASPLATGWMLVRFGPMAAFGAAAASTIAAALPLLWTPDVRVAPQVQGAYRAARFGIAMFVMDGWIASGTVFVWQIGLFLSLRQSYLGYAGALAVAIVARPLDRYRPRRQRSVARARKLRFACAVARGRRGASGARSHGQCADADRFMSLHAGVDDRGVQPGETIALRVALSCGDGRRLGCRRRGRLFVCRGVALRRRGDWRRVAVADHWNCRGLCCIAPLLYRASDCTGPRTRRIRTVTHTLKFSASARITCG